MTLLEAAFCLSIIVLSGVSILTIYWLKKFREQVRTNVNSMNEQNIHISKRLTDLIAALQNQQHQSDGNLQKLAEAHLKLKHDVAAVADRVIHEEQENTARNRVVH